MRHVLCACSGLVFNVDGSFTYMSRLSLTLYSVLHPPFMQGGRTALIDAACSGNLNIVKLLLKNGANIEHEDKVK